MPNHVTNIISIEDAGGTLLADIRAKFLNDKGQVDFRVIRPSPKCLEGFEPHSGIISRATSALGLLPDPNSLSGGDIGTLTKRLELSNAIRNVTTKARDEDIPLIARAIQNYAECGYMYWYDWNQENWGTKWNAYCQPDDGFPQDATEFRFETAWSHPADLMTSLSESLPNVVFGIKYADEDTGSNCGTYRIRSGKRFDEDIAPRFDDQSETEKRRWCEFSFRLRHGDDVDPASYGYDDNWVYSDEVYEDYEKSQAAATRH
jgi:hypothetical protein